MKRNIFFLFITEYSNFEFRVLTITTAREVEPLVAASVNLYAGYLIRGIRCSTLHYLDTVTLDIHTLNSLSFHNLYGSNKQFLERKYPRIT